MARIFFSGALKPASSTPFQASATESPRAKASSPRPACSRLRFSTDALVAWTEVLEPSIPLLYSCDRATPIGQYTPLVPPVSTLMKVGAASTAVLAVIAAAAANRLIFLVSRMEVSPSLLWLYAEFHSRRPNRSGVDGARSAAQGAALDKSRGRRGREAAHARQRVRHGARGMAVHGLTSCRCYG